MVSVRDNSKKAKVAVLGASGFLGSHVARVFADAGYAVICCNRQETAPNDVSEAGLAVATVAFDIANSSASPLWELAPQIIVNCAAYGVATAERDVELALTVNATSLATLVPLANHHRVERFIHVGTAAEYGAYDSPIREDMGLNPVGLYGQTKAAGSIIALAAASTLEMSLCVARPFGIYGPGEDPSKFVPGLLRALAAGRSIDLTSGRAVRDYVFVDDVCGALLSLIKPPAADVRAQVFNIASGHPVSIRELGEAVVAAVGADPSLAQWNALPDRAGEVPILVGCSERITKQTGWAAHTSLAYGIQHTIELLQR